MANLLWALLGMLAREMVPGLAKILLRVSSKFGSFLIRYFRSRGRRKKMLNLLAGRARRKETRAAGSGEGRGKDMAEQSETEDADL